MISKFRSPTSPGEMLLEEFMRPLGMSQSELAQKIGYSRRTVGRILRNEKRIDEDLANRLSGVFGNSAEFWLTLQTIYDDSNIYDTLARDAGFELESHLGVPIHTEPSVVVLKSEIDSRSRSVDWTEVEATSTKASEPWYERPWKRFIIWLIGKTKSWFE